MLSAKPSQFTMLGTKAPRKERMLIFVVNTHRKKEGYGTTKRIYPLGTCVVHTTFPQTGRNEIVAIERRDRMDG